jgi:hypothetical protein
MPDRLANADVLGEAAQRMHADLDRRREAISRELCTIPPPVPACDVNFNRLLEERARVVDELQALGRLRAANAGAEALLAFCRHSAALDPETRSAIESMLATAR